MHIEKYRSNGIDYLRLVEGKRMRNKDGSSIVGKRVVASLGAYARHDDGRPTRATTTAGPTIWRGSASRSAMEGR